VLRRRLVLGLGAWLSLLGLSFGNCEWLPGLSAPPEKPRPRMLHCYHRTMIREDESPGRAVFRDPGERERLLAPPPSRAPERGTRPGPHCWLTPRVLDKARAGLAIAQARAKTREQA
jgi:hypothetical protein